ncbi:AAA family ATPase [Halosquirtibacter laminarini]|uniref:AAA family ATPase n=1 Tax=Halosquirtibacter laminarini TaxID=3374600 RepID=A0AC61NJH7_9BACT|nr:AAA family ATPase [Prolixibacteraceae bacterium]
MIINKIEIQNFQCYYDTKTFEFTKGLNVVVAANSHGKSKLFDAILWLFTGSLAQEGQRFHLENLISKKAIDLKRCFDVSVLIECEKDQKKFSIRRYFEVSIDAPGNNLVLSKVECKGTVEERISGERNIVDGQDLIDELFPPILRKYSLFKGERSLNIFDPKTNKDALKNLVNALSNFRSLDAYVEIAKKAFNDNQKMLDKKIKNTRKEQNKYERAIKARDKAQLEKNRAEQDLKGLVSEKYNIEKLMEDNLDSIELGPKLANLNQKITVLEEELRDKQTNLRLKEDYIVKLFDEKWILVNFAPIELDFEKKVASLQRKKRKLTKEHDIKLGEEKGKRDLIAEMTKSDTPLPIGAPTQEHMEEMLNEEVCKVCNRTAPKGSEAYEFMNARLQEFINHYSIEKEEEEEVPAFKNEFIEELTDLKKEFLPKRKSVESLFEEIQFNNDMLSRLSNEISDLRDKLDILNGDKEKLLSKSLVGEEGLMDAATSLRQYKIELPRIEKKIRDKKQKINDSKKSLEDAESLLGKINREDLTSDENLKHQILRDLKEITFDVKEQKFNQFLENLQNQANKYYSSFGLASSGYTGQIKITKSKYDESIRIQTVDKGSDMDITHSLSSSTQTAVNLSILMAI